jgi:hypothetical protein
VSRSGSVSGFLPSTCGLRFANRFAPGPTVRLGFLDPRLVGIGDASAGLCGGMSWLVRDRFASGGAMPTDEDAPANGSPLFRELVQWQLRSLRWLFAPWRFYVMAAGGSKRALRDSRLKEFPAVRSAIDDGRLAIVGLVRKASWNPLQLTDNHQVLAYAYDLADDGTITISIYDPNWPTRDDVVLTLAPDGATQSTAEPLLGTLALD